MDTTLGETGLTVTRIGLGLAALGRPAYINLGHAADLAGHTDVGSMEQGAHAVLDAAYAGGLTPATVLEGPRTVVFGDMRELPRLLDGHPWTRPSARPV